MSKINQILNVSSREWPRIIVVWSMMFLTRFGFIVGWSVLVATFLSKVGVNWLPALFLANASLVMLGTLFYRRIIHLVKRELLITFTVLGAAAFLLTSILFIHSNTTLFFTLLLIAESVLLAQLTILLSLFNEEIFTPLESQRTFPIIESAETIGGIAGGLMLSLLANSVPSYKFIIIWAIAIILILPIVLKYNSNTMDVPKLEKEKPKKITKSLCKNIKGLTKSPFVKGLALIVILHWGMMNMVEFQYTKAIHQDVYSVQEETLVLDEHSGGVVLSTEGFTEEQAEHYEHQITQKLGFLHMVFNAVALLIQLVLASRIITSIGIVSTMLLHPIITILNMLGLTLRFGFMTAALTRGSYELTGLLFKDSYDSSYYAIPHDKRDDVKELMQGIMKPFGAILGTIAIILIAFNMDGLRETFSLNIMIIILGVIMAIAIANLSRKYTALSEQNLSRKQDLATRLNAIEVLAQKGHEKTPASLQKILKRSSEPNIIKEKILLTLGSRQDPESIGIILKMLRHEEASIRLAAIEALSKFEFLTKKKASHSFTRYRVIKVLERRLKKENNDTIREKITIYFHKVDPEELTRFLVKSISKKNSREHTEQAGFIRMLKLFKDPNLIHYLEKYLEHKNPKLKSASIIALWQFKHMHPTLKHYIKQMLESKRLSNLKEGIRTCGHIKYPNIKTKLKRFLNHSHKEIRESAILTLAQMEDAIVIPHLIALLTDSEHKWFKETTSILGTLPKRFKETIESHLHLHVTEMIHEIMEKNPKIEETKEETLELLKALYHKLSAHHEAEKIKSWLDSKRDS
jgi:HEAT repeat protein/ATP/ADP translocase